MKLHHIGIVVNNIERQAPRCAGQFGLRQVSAIIHDPIQKANVQFWTDGGSVNYEFIQPAAEDSPVRRTLENGGGLAHLCFEVSDIDAAVRGAVSQGRSWCVDPLRRLPSTIALSLFSFSAAWDW